MNIIAVVFSYLCLFCLGFLDNSRGPLYPQILKSFNMEPSIGSFFFSISAFSSFLIALGTGKIIRKYALVIPSQIGVLCYAASAFFIGIAPFDGGIYVLMFGSFCLGLGWGFIV